MSRRAFPPLPIVTRNAEVEARVARRLAGGVMTRGGLP